jgi:hypothetical protein
MAKQEFKAPLEQVSAAKLKAVKKKRLNLKPLLGKWLNCDNKTGSLVRVELGSRRGILTVHPFGACTPTPCDWGAVKGLAYSESVSSIDAVAFTAIFKFSFKETIVTGHLCEGCLLVETYNHFTDSSGRCDYYSRDCFCRH